MSSNFFVFPVTAKLTVYLFELLVLLGEDSIAQFWLLFEQARAQVLLSPVREDYHDCA
jgi:hypothetical protein